jgi:hypothetical protein
MPLHPGNRIGSYEIVSQLGAGGMGEVYRARDSKLKREVAIKVLPADVATDKERLARFQREAEVLASLNHPNIAQVHGFEGDSPAEAGRRSDSFLVMELVEGEDLSQRIARGAIPIDEALPIAKQIAEALEAAHDAGIVHRDLKPANVKVREDGTVKVLDFGLAKGSGQGSGIGDQGSGDLANSPTITSPAMTMRGVILGTAAYMSPEQAKGKAVDKRADIWAFGCVLFEMLTGKRVFKGDDVTDIITSVMRDTPAWASLPPGTPHSVRQLIQRCLERDPRARLRDIGEARIVLQNPEAQPSTAPAVTRGLPYAAVAAIAIACMGIAGGAAWTIRRPAAAVERATFMASWPFTGFNVNVSRLAAQRNLIALSRNGRTMAAIGTNLMFRSTDSLTWTEVPNTRDTTSVFLSPNGEWVGFITRTGISKLRVTGGTPVILYTARDTSAFSATDATWADDDQIYFVSIDGSFSIAANGGEPKQIDASTENATIEVLPGTGDLLLTRGRRLETPVVVLRSKDGQETTLLTDAHDPRFVAPDVLLFVRNATLMGARFDPRARRMTGDPVALIENIAVLGTSGQYSVIDNGMLVYLPESFDTTSRSRLALRTAKEIHPVVGETSRRYSDPRFSPDGQKLALHIFEQEDDIWVLDLARKAMTRLSFEPGEDETPAWSPDGQWIAFAGFGRANTGRRAVLRRRADGSGTEEVLWTGDDHTHVTDWSPDGRSVLMELVHPQRRSDLVAIDVDSKKVRPILETPFNEAGARLSPDGKWLVYQSDESGRFEIYVVSYPALDKKIQVSTTGAEQPVWARDGRAIYYRTDKDIERAAVNGDGSTLTVSAPVALFPDTYLRPQAVNHTTIDVTAAGEVLVFDRIEQSRAPDVIGIVNWVDEVRRKLGLR